MKIGIIQTSVGATGGNDTVLRDVIDILKPKHEIVLYTFDRPSDRFSDVKTISKLPIRIPMLGIYKKFMMPKFDYKDCDLLFSITGYANIKTDKPLLIYDQNNLGAELLNKNVSRKYRKGFWKLYYQPYKLLSKFQKPNLNARYIANSKYSAKILEEAVGKKVDILYPSVDINQYKFLKKKNQIAMLCRISPDKNLEFAIDVLNRQDKPVVIIGAVTNMTMRYFNKLQEMCKSHIRISPNISRDNLKEILAESKIFFHTGEETFGISVVEGIASGCVPIVPDNTAHRETVPFEELRYEPDNVKDALDKLKNAWCYNHTLEPLYSNVLQFDKKYFKQRLLKIVEESV